MRDKIELSGSTEYNPKFPPANAKRGYVARITGRESGPTKYKREFLGQEATILEGDEGLYERQRGEKKGGFTRWYHVILRHPEHGLIRSVDCESEVPKIAKMLDEGFSIEDAVEITNLREHETAAGLFVFDAVARTAAQAKKAAIGQTVETAVDACYAAMASLPEKEQKKVLADLKNRLFPKAETSQPPQESDQ